MPGREKEIIPHLPENLLFERNHSPQTTVEAEQSNALHLCAFQGPL